MVHFVVVFHRTYLTRLGECMQVNRTLYKNVLILIFATASLGAFASEFYTEHIDIVNESNQPFDYDVTVPARTNANIEIKLIKIPQHKGRLWEAVTNNQTAEVIAAINEGADVNEKDGEGKTPLHYAVEYGNNEIIQVLINAGANVNAKNFFEVTPLHVAVTREMRVIAQILIYAGANVNEKNKYGQMPLLMAAYVGNVEIAQMLISAGANVNEEDMYGSTPLYWAVAMKHTHMVKILLSSGANVEGNDRAHEKLKSVLRCSGNEEIRKMISDACHDGHHKHISCIPGFPSYITTILWDRMLFPLYR